MATKKGRKRVTVTLAIDVYEIIKKKAENATSSPGEVIETIIRHYLYNGGKRDV